MSVIFTQDYPRQQPPGGGYPGGPPPPPDTYSRHPYPDPYGPQPHPVAGSHYDPRGSVRGPPPGSPPPPGSTIGGASTAGFDRDRDGYRDGAWGYRCRFLGSQSMGTDEPQPETVGKVVDSLIEYYKGTEVQPRRYLIRIRSTILELEELENDEVHIQNVPLDAITFCASDNRYPRIFTFVARAESGYMCHVFYCRHVSDVDRLTKDFDDAFRNCFVQYQQGGRSAAPSTAGGTVRDQISSQGIRDPAIVQAVEAALHPRPSRYRANVKEVLVEERPRSLPLYNFQGQRVKSVRSRPVTGNEPSSTRYIFAYEDDDDVSTAQHHRRSGGRRSHRFPVAKEQFRFNSERGSSRREYRREYIQGSQRVIDSEGEQPQVRRQYVVAAEVDQPARSVAAAAAPPASYRTEFVEADGRAYREFFDGEAAGHPIPAADGPASIIVEDRDIGYGRRGEQPYGSVRQTAQPPQDGGYGLYASAGNNRSDMLY